MVTYVGGSTLSIGWDNHHILMGGDRRFSPQARTVRSCVFMSWDVYFVSFCDFQIAFWNCPESVVYILFTPYSFSD